MSERRCYGPSERVLFRLHRAQEEGDDDAEGIVVDL